jgi:hypothetical protein
LLVGVPNKEYNMALKRSLIAACAILACLMFAWATGAGRPYPASAGGVIDPTCVSSLPCIEYDNNGSGPGIRGVSLTGNGSNGITRVNSTSAATGREGVFGNDMSTSGSFNSGVRGLSVRGTGVLGNSTSGAGVLGLGSIGIEGNNTSNATSDAVFAKGVGGRLFRGNNSHSVDVFTVDDGGNVNLTGSQTINGSENVGGLLSVGGYVGIESSPTSTTSLTIGTLGALDFGIDSFGNIIGVVGAGNTVAVEAIAQSGTAAAVRAFGDGGLIYDGWGISGERFTVDDSGNVHAHTFTANLAAATGQKLVTYAPQASEPTIEDFGEAQLTSGAAYVHLESRFASTMAQSNYLVFLTPEGDNRGLYVTQKSPIGFAVRESQGGHSTLAFSYRIVARPLGNVAPRLPVEIERRVPKPILPRATTHPYLRST